MKPEDAEEYTQALGQVVAGSWRQVALAQRLGVPQALNLTVEEWVQQRLGGYIKLSVQERRLASVEAYAELKSTTKVADVLGVSDETVRRDLLASTNVEVDETNTPDDDECVSTNVEVEPPTAEQWAYLDEVQQRAEQLKQQQADHPDAFAADDIFDVLDYAVETVDTWIEKVGLAATPGSKSAAEWQVLIDRLRGVTDFVRRLHEKTYAGQ